MLKRILQGVAFMVVGPFIGFWLAMYAFVGNGSGDAPSMITVLLGAAAMFVMPVIGLKMTWWATKIAVKRRIEREVDLRFVSGQGHRIREARAKSW